MKIKNIEGLSAADLQLAVNKGGRFVHYIYTISIILFTFRKKSGVYLLPSKELKHNKGYLFSLISFFFGWWAIPSGPKHTLASLATNFRGGKDVTDEVMSVITGYALYEENRNTKTADKQVPNTIII